MSAGNSPAGRAFAAKHADINFVVIQNAEDGRELIKEVKGQARRDFDREIQVFGMGRIVCRDTEEEAIAYNDYMLNEKGDWEAASNMASQLGVNSESLPQEAWAGMGGAIIGGFSAIPLVGTPEQIVAGMQEMSDVGFDGISLNWPDYKAGLEQYNEVLRPLLVEAGLRAD
jgi:alkanesulfonate monooxygenase SsuD/methylene tetrahydromethanopterin reductase-like flavin-dependent oxidoreductase (luciferase family)